MLKHKLREVLSSSSDSIFVPKWKSEGEKKERKDLLNSHTLLECNHWIWTGDPS